MATDVSTGGDGDRSKINCYFKVMIRLKNVTSL